MVGLLRPVHALDADGLVQHVANYLEGLNSQLSIRDGAGIL